MEPSSVDTRSPKLLKSKSAEPELLASESGVAKAITDLSVNDAAKSRNIKDRDASLEDGEITTQREFIKDAKIVKPSQMLPLTIDSTKVALSQRELYPIVSASVSSISGANERISKRSPRFLEIGKKILVTLHLVSIQISSNIDIKLGCACNDSEMHYSHVHRVDHKSRTASFQDQVITIRLDRVKQGGNYASLTRSNLSSCDISMASDATRDRDSVTLNLKLFAVSDTRQKLIGLINIPIDWKAS